MKRFHRQAEDAEQNADIVRRLLLNRGRMVELEDLTSNEEKEMNEVTNQPLLD